MKRERKKAWIKIAVTAAMLVLVLFALDQGVRQIGSGQQAESLKQLERSLRKATLTCYASEGVYPPTIDYLEENYGIQIDREQYTVFYEIFGDNIMPEITVMEKQS